MGETDAKLRKDFPMQIVISVAFERVRGSIDRFEVKSF